MKKTAAFVLTALVGIAFGLFLNDLAHRYTSWLYQVHYGETLEMGSISVPRFFAAPIYGTMGFFSALYALVSAGDSRKRMGSGLLFYASGVAAGFGVVLGIHPLFHRLATDLSGDSAFKIYIGLDVFVSPLVVFGTAIVLVRWFLVVERSTFSWTQRAKGFRGSLRGIVPAQKDSTSSGIATGSTHPSRSPPRAP